MATVGTIAVTLTADSRPFTRGINIAKGETEGFGKAFARLDAQAKRLGSGGGMAQSLNETGRATGSAARGFWNCLAGWKTHPSDTSSTVCGERCKAHRTTFRRWRL